MFGTPPRANTMYVLLYYNMCRNEWTCRRNPQNINPRMKAAIWAQQQGYTSPPSMVESKVK